MAKSTNPFPRRPAGFYAAGPVLAALLLAGCMDNAPNAYDRAFSGCLAETGAPGRYTANPKELGPNGLPVIRVAEGGTIRGQALMMACVEARMRPGSGKVVTAAAAPPTVKPAPGRNVGGLPLPTQYVLMAGDAELWNTLTRAQQERALLFLRNGSTIRSSLLGDP